MHTKNFGIAGQRRAQADRAEQSARYLDLLLWVAWALVVGLVGLWEWYAAYAAGRPLALLGLVIHCLLAGLIGLIVLTLIEMRCAPERFL